MHCFYRSTGRRLAAALLPAALLFGTACDDITSTEQEAPSRVLADQLYVPANAQLLLNSAIGDFECALANYIVAAGLVADELGDAQLGQVGWDYDRRTIVPALTVYAATACGATQVPGLYTPLSVARFQADRLLDALEGWTDTQVQNRQSLIGQAAAYAGYALVLLGEGMCSAAIDLGPEMTREELNAEAEERFTTAITAATAANDEATLNMARVGRARARLNQGKLAEARADAALVPDGFVKNATYSTVNARRENLVNTQTYRGNFSTVEPSFRNVQWGGAPDPRVAVVNSNTPGQDRVTIIWRPAKYPAIGSPIPIATWREARLIEAEALAATDPAGATALINRLHTAAGISPFGGGSSAEVTAQVREERRRELFLEGHRLNDMIRFDVPLVPAPGTPFPVKGGLYGDQLCFPLPDLERNNNPNIS